MMIIFQPALKHLGQCHHRTNYDQRLRGGDFVNLNAQVFDILFGG
jgi:hypothetical protein